MDDRAGTPATSVYPDGNAAAVDAGAVQRSLSHSVRDGCLHALMLGSGEAYFAAYAIALQGGSLLIGLLAALPLLAGSLVQFVSVHLLDRGARRKLLCVVPALVQAFVFIPLVALPLLAPPARGPWLALACVTVYFACGNLVTPAWNSWMGDLVAPERRGDYFGRRDRLRTACQLLGVLAAGAALSVAGAVGNELAGFAAIFALALISRLLSVWQLWRMVEPPHPPPAREHSFTFLDFLRRMPRSNFGRFTLYVAVMQGITQVAGPFFSLYMLRDLKFTYLEFTAASTVCIFTQALTLHNWGKVADRIGNFAVLRVTGFLIPVIPLLWVATARFEWILVFQAVSGFLWAGFNLSAANFIFDAVSAPKRARCVAYYHALVNSFFVAGAVTGGVIAPFLPAALPLPGFTAALVSNLQVLFLISGLGRLAVSLVFLPFIREVRAVERLSAVRVVFQVVGLSAIRGIRFSVFNGVHPSELGEEKPTAEEVETAAAGVSGSPAPIEGDRRLG